MYLPSKLRFKAINNLSLEEINNSNYVIYSHVCSEGVYVGMSSDPVKRWQEHLSDAFNKDSQYYDDKFRVAIRTCGSAFTHYIVAVAALEKAARNKEAAAIEFYGDRLNMREERNYSDQDYGFRPIDNQISLDVVLEKKRSKGTSSGRDDSDRKTIIGEIYTQYGRKRLRSIDGQAFPAGMNIECPRDERARFNNGDKVRVNVAMSEKPNGTKYLVSAKTAKLVLAK